MDAVKMKQSEDKVLGQSSLAHSIKVAYDRDKLIWASTAAVTLLKKVLDMPVVNHFFDYHKFHAAYLASILISVGKMEPIQDEIERMQVNIDSYVRDTGQLLETVKQFPSDPLGGLRNPVVILQIAQDPKTAAAYDDMLNAYQQAAQAVLAAALACGQQGRAIENETRVQAQQMLDKLGAMTPKTPADQVLIGASKKKVEFLQFDLMTRVQGARSRAEDAAKTLQPLVELVSGIDRIGGRR